MVIQQLLSNLLHGYAITATNADGSTYQETKPPNTHMLQAAKVIQELYQQQELLQHIIQNQQHQINQLLKENDVQVSEKAQNPTSNEGGESASSSPTPSAS